MDPHRYELALDEARRALDKQASDLMSLRERSSGLVGIGGLAAAFLGGLAIRNEEPLSAWTVAGAASFATLLVIAVVALWPRQFVFTQHADQLVTWADEGDDPADMDRNLALHMTNHFDANATRLDRLTRLYTAGLVILVLEISFLFVDLRGR